jgi:hypothetical protein
MFKALFTPYAEWSRRDLAFSPYRKRLKWDWHLRHFLYALLPAAFVFFSCEIIEYKYDLKKSTAIAFKKGKAFPVESKSVSTQTAPELLSGKEDESSS